MMQELRNHHGKVNAVYEAAQKENSLVDKINNSPLGPAERGTLLALFEQAGRAIYVDNPLSFANQIKNPPKPLHNPSLLYDSSIFLDLTMAAMQELTSQYDDPQLNEATESFYAGIQEGIRRYLPRYFSDRGVSEEIIHLLEDFYDWHIRPTLSAARQLAMSKPEQIKPIFKEDLRSVREHMDKIYSALLSRKPYKEIVEHAPKVLEAISTAHIDREYPEGSLERPFLVNLYAGAYFLNSIAKKRMEIEAKTLKVEIPRHEQRYRYDPITPQ